MSKKIVMVLLMSAMMVSVSFAQATPEVATNSTTSTDTPKQKTSHKGKNGTKVHHKHTAGKKKPVADATTGTPKN